MNQCKSIPDDRIFLTKSASINVTKSEYEFGDEFVATITSRDGGERTKKFGGDYYRARLIRGIPYHPDGIPCRVVDNEDGAYTVKAPLVLKGKLNLNVVLVQSFEWIIQVEQMTEHLTSWNPKYFVTLESKEEVPCKVDSSAYKE